MQVKLSAYWAINSLEIKPLLLTLNTRKANSGQDIGNVTSVCSKTGWNALF